MEELLACRWSNAKQAVEGLTAFAKQGDLDAVLVLIEALDDRKVNPLSLLLGQGSRDRAKDLLYAAACSGRPRIMSLVWDAVYVWLRLPPPPAEVRESTTVEQ